MDKLIVLAGLLTLAACAPAPVSKSTSNNADVVQLPNAGFSAVYRITDKSTGVTCYVSSEAGAGGGIFCIQENSNE